MATQADCPAKVTLSGYQLIATYSLPSATLSGASAVAWNWDSDTLLIVPDSGLVMVMVSKTGVVEVMLREMSRDTVQTLKSVKQTERFLHLDSWSAQVWQLGVLWLSIKAPTLRDLYGSVASLLARATSQAVLG